MHTCHAFRDKEGTNRRFAGNVVTLVMSRDEAHHQGGFTSVGVTQYHDLEFHLREFHVRHGGGVSVDVGVSVGVLKVYYYCNSMG